MAALFAAAGCKSIVGDDKPTDGGIYTHLSAMKDGETLKIPEITL